MLAHELCATLCLSDINPDAVKALRRTVAVNGLSDRVAVYLSNNLKTIPRTERWDLVVSNPPHFVDEYLGSRLAHDPGWSIHREFFATIEPFLKPRGVIVLQENNAGSTMETFRGMIEHSGLKIAFVHGASPQRTPDHRYYYIGIMRRADVVPGWAKPM
jgi:methylase of polypeptide subunit release factors